MRTNNNEPLSLDEAIREQIKAGIVVPLKLITLDSERTGEYRDRVLECLDQQAQNFGHRKPTDDDLAEIFRHLDAIMRVLGAEPSR